MLQAMDILGERTSRTIRIENPLYQPYVPWVELTPVEVIVQQVYQKH